MQDSKPERTKYNLQRVFRKDGSEYKQDPEWIEIRDSSGHLLMRYNPFSNCIELKRNGKVYDLIKLDEIREKYGIILASKPEALDVIEVPDKKA